MCTTGTYWIQSSWRSWREFDIVITPLESASLSTDLYQPVFSHTAIITEKKNAENVTIMTITTHRKQLITIQVINQTIKSKRKRSYALTPNFTSFITITSSFISKHFGKTKIYSITNSQIKFWKPFSLKTFLNQKTNHIDTFEIKIFQTKLFKLKFSKSLSTKSWRWNKLSKPSINKTFILF